MAAGIHVFPTENEVLKQLAEYFVIETNEAVHKNGRFAVALSGGSSPKKLYELLSSPAFKNRIDWANVFFFFGDERNVPATDPDSNYAMAKKALLDPLQISPANIFAVDTTLPPEAAALLYTETISHFFGDAGMRFDLVLLGLGDNAHTASLFPHTPILRATTPSIEAIFLSEQNVFRISFTAPLINLAHHVAFLVYGKAKAAAVKNILEDAKNIEAYPAQLIHPVSGTLDWFLDAPAASALQSISQ